MEHLQEILKVWADLHNKPSKTPKERQMMNELASILPRYGGGPVIHKMKVVRAGGDPFSVEPALEAVVKKAGKAVKEAPHITGFIDTPVEQFTDRETEIESFVDEQEKKSPQLSIDPVNVVAGKRGPKPKVKE